MEPEEALREAVEQFESQGMQFKIIARLLQCKKCLLSLHVIYLTIL